MYPLLDIQTLIMLVVLIVENPLWGTFSNLWEVPYVGDLVSKSVLLCPLQKQSMLQLVRHVRKYVAACTEASDMGIPQLVTIMFCDRHSVIALVKNPVYHAKTKHIGVRHHFIRECIASGYTSLEKCCLSRKYRRCIDQSSTA